MFEKGDLIKHNPHDYTYEVIHVEEDGCLVLNHELKKKYWIENNGLEMYRKAETFEV